MTRRESYMVERIDRSKEHAGAKAARVAHFERIDQMAERSLAVSFTNKADAITFLRCVAGRVLARLCKIDGGHHAYSLFAALLKGDDYRSLARDLARVEAEHVFAKLTTAANDRGDA